MTVGAVAQEAAKQLDVWGIVGIAAAIATALATGISTAVAIYWRWVDRQEAEFHCERLKAAMWLRQHAENDDRQPVLIVRVSNVGDGKAFKVQTTKSADIASVFIKRDAEGEQMQQLPEPIPIIDPGQSVIVTIRLESLDQWHTARFVISWWPPPTRKKTRWLFWSRELTAAFDLASISEAPQNTR